MRVPDPFRLLVLVHEASRTGATLQLLHALRAWPAAEVEPIVLIRRGGALADDFQAWPCTSIALPGEEMLWRRLTVVKVTAARVAGRVAADSGSAEPDGIRWHLRQRMVWDRANLALRRVVQRAKPHVVLANTVTHGDIIDAFRGVPVVTHAHERSDLLRRLTLPHTADRQLTRSARVVAVSNLVRADLVGARGVPSAKIDVIPPFVPPLPRSAEDAVTARARVRRELRVPPEAVLVGNVGSVAWEKDPEAFVEMAARVRTLLPDTLAEFVWVGRAADPRDVERCHALAQERGISVTFAGEWRDPRPFYCAIDLLVSTSRTESFGLTLLEAGRESVATVCFDAAGGAHDFVRSDAGVVVPAGDITAMAHAVAELVADAPRRRRLGEVAAARVAAEHDITLVAPRLLGVLQEVAAAHRGDS